jgi:hypothetical protein
MSETLASRFNHNLEINGDIDITGIYKIKGEKFEARVRGEQGIQGVQGIQGERGEKGERGWPGKQGLQGLPGPQGVQGIQGSKGDTGSFDFDGTLSTEDVLNLVGEKGVRITSGGGDSGGTLTWRAWNRDHLELENIRIVNDDSCITLRKGSAL